jgi:hypothetical protein
MARYITYYSTLRSFLWSAALGAFVCAAPATFAQHGGGGAGHFGGGGRVSSPRVSTPRVAGPPASVPHVAPPPTIVHVPAPVIRMAGPPAAGVGTRSFVAGPPRVHIIPPRPILGNRLIPPPSSPEGAGPHVTIGFPSTTTRERIFVPGQQRLNFSGEGGEIHQNASPSTVRVDPNDRSRIHIHPRSPVPIFRGRPGFPGVGRPFFGFGPFGSPFFGGPFIGFGLGWGLNWWGPTCGPSWGWGYGCNTLPLFDYGYGAGGYYENPNYGPAENLEAQPENQANQPYIYEYPPAPVTGGGERELVELYLKDGSVYRVTDYWLVNDELHFTTLDATGTTQTENVVAFSELDLQKTVDVNSAHGFRFVLRNQPVQEYLEQQQNGPETPAQPAQPRTPQGAAGPPNPQ